MTVEQATLSRTENWHAVWGLPLMAALLCAGLLLRTTTALAVYSLALLLCAAALFTVEYRRGDLASPLAIYAVLMTVHFALPGFVAAADPFFFVDPSNLRYSDLGQLFVLLSFGAFWVGYRVACPGGRLPEVADRSAAMNWDRDKLVAVVAVLIIVGWLARIFVFYSGSYFQADRGVAGHIDTIWLSTVQMLEQLPRTALLLLAIFYWSLDAPARRLRSVLACVWLAELLYWLPTGRKEEIILSVILPLMVRYLLTLRLISWRKGLVLGAFMIALFPLTHYYRVAVDLAEEADIDFGTRVRAALTLAEETEVLTEIDYSTVLLGRLSLLEPLDAAVRLIEEERWEKQWGRSYADFFVGLIPRVFWPTKPDFHYGTEFGHRSGMLDESDDVTSISVTLFGEAFLNFGVAGALVAGCIGYIFGAIYVGFRNGRRPNALFIYLVSLPVVFYVGGTFVLYFLGLAKTLLLAAVLLMMFRTVPSRAAP